MFFVRTDLNDASPCHGLNSCLSCSRGRVQHSAPQPYGARRCRQRNDGLGDTMILHWFTTGWRSLISNPLFSLITIISLSIGCAGALLVGANIKQHLSFDRWMPGADRTFILTRDL